eukprot:SAG31_NODE_14303_length_815_cov_1.589385_1_plen_225_part_01
MNPKSSRELMADLCFDTFGVPALFIVNTAVLSLFCYGRTTGVVLTSGESTTSAVPVYECYSLPHAIARFDIGGRHVTNHMVQLLAASGHFNFHSTVAEREIVRDIKEKLGIVAHARGFRTEANASDGRHTSVALQAEYHLPDGNVVVIGDERAQCTEPLFNPMIIGIDALGAPQLLHRAITLCEGICDELYCNIVLAGGNTMFEGFAERLEQEIATLAPPNAHPR